MKRILKTIGACSPLQKPVEDEKVELEKVGEIVDNSFEKVTPSKQNLII
jgi:hypothetical protein